MKANNVKEIETTISSHCFGGTVATYVLDVDCGLPGFQSCSDHCLAFDLSLFDKEWRFAYRQLGFVGILRSLNCGGQFRTDDTNQWLEEPERTIAQ